MEKNFKQILPSIKAFVFDVDGVLTDGSVVLMPDGEQIRTMNIKDGYALQLAIKKCYYVAIITGGKSEAIKARMEGLGVSDIYLGAHNKIDSLADFMGIYDIKYEEILYMGDDIPDYECMQKVAAATCPSDAAPEIKAICTYISQQPGGKGCVRDVLEQVMRVQGKWFDGDAFKW